MLDSCYHVLTPEGLELSLVAAGPARRTQAWLLDVAIRAAGYVTLGTLIALLLPPRTGTGLYWILTFLIEWFYPVLFEVYGGGATPGKRWAKLMVLHDNGTPVGWMASLTRNILLVADFLPLCYGFGLCSRLLDRHFRRLGDLAAGTVVVYCEAPQKQFDFSAVEPKAVPFPLQLEEQRAVLEFAERCGRLSVQRQQELANLAAPLARAQNAEAVTNLCQIASGIVGAQR